MSTSETKEQISPDDYVSEDRQQELIRLANRGLIATAIREAICDGVRAALSTRQEAKLT